MAGKSWRNLSFQRREEGLRLGFLAVAIMGRPFQTKDRPRPGRSCSMEQNRPGNVPRLQSENTVRSTGGTMLLEPQKTKRPADWLSRWPISGSIRPKKRSPVAFACNERKQRGRNDSFYYRSIKVICPKSRLF